MIILKAHNKEVIINKKYIKNTRIRTYEDGSFLIDIKAENEEYKFFLSKADMEIIREKISRNIPDTITLTTIGKIIEK